MHNAAVLDFKGHRVAAVRNRQPAEHAILQRLLCFRRVQRIEAGLLHETLGDDSEPDAVQVQHARVVHDHGPFKLHLPFLQHPRQHGRVQSEIDVHRDRIDVMPPRRGNRSVDHGNHGNPEVRRDAEQQAEVLLVHVARNGQRQAIAGFRHALPQRFELLADEIGRGEVLEAGVREGRGSQVVPVVILDTARLQTGIGPGVTPGDEAVVLKQRVTRLTTQDALSVRDQEACIDEMCCQ